MKGGRVGTISVIVWCFWFAHFTPTCTKRSTKPNMFMWGHCLCTAEVAGAQPPVQRVLKAPGLPVPMWAVTCAYDTPDLLQTPPDMSWLLLRHVADEIELLHLKTLVTEVSRLWQHRQRFQMKESTWGKPWCAGASFGIILQQVGCAPEEKLCERKQLKLELIKYNASWCNK